jgi:hypothetical protein
MDLTFGGEMRPVLLAIAVVALVSSCANTKGENAPADLKPTAPDVFHDVTPIPENDSEGDSEIINPKPIDMTNRSICNGPTPEMTWLFSSAWSARQKLANGVELERRLSFSQSDVEVTVTARYKGKFEQIKVMSLINWNDTAVNLLSVDQDHAVLPLENEDFNLSFSVSPSALNYSFVGPCLQIELGNSEKLLFAPVEEE